MKQSVNENETLLVFYIKNLKFCVDELIRGTFNRLWSELRHHTMTMLLN